MKRILITGKDSYIGTNFKNYLEVYPEEYEVVELDVRDESWKNYDFTPYDVVFHVAGIAHIKEVKENEALYYKVNRDLVIELAKKAKVAGVTQFIFMSSMSVYGINQGVINLDTKPKPNTYYGKSKYEAELKLNELEDNGFKICVVRPPMVYGDNSPGNLTKLIKAVKKFHIFPTIRNQRSSITIEKLTEQIKEYVDLEAEGIFLPQNAEYLCTYKIVKEKMEVEGVYVFYTSFFNLIIKTLIGKINIITKIFGDLKYEK